MYSKWNNCESNAVVDSIISYESPEDSSRKDLEKSDVSLSSSRYGPPTDGGYGWIVVGASFMLLFVAFGLVFTYGIFLQHYSTVTFKDNSNLTTLTFVGTLASSLITFCALVTGGISDKLGYRNTILIGGTLFSSGFLLASFATQVWHLFLTQGVMVGIGASLSFPPAFAAPAQWFEKRRGLATGIAVSGSGVGGLIISPMIQAIIEILDVKWALRIVAIASFVIMYITAFLIQERTEPNTRRRLVIDLRWFKNEKFLMFFLAGFATTFGYLVPFFLIPNYSVSIGLTVRQSSFLIGLISGSSGVGRILTGFAADKLGRINILLLCVTVTTLSCFVIWPLSKDFGSLTAFAILYGFASGGYVAMTPVILAGLFGLEDLASLVGLTTFSNAIPSLIGTPIATAILKYGSDGYNPTSYFPVIVYAGASALLGALFLFRIRFIVSKKVFIKV